MTPDAFPPAADECYRCGYNLLGIEDQSPCPECGLLAVRSRRESDDLHNSRPRWLGRLALGIKLILLGIALLFGGPIAVSILAGYLPASAWNRLYFDSPIVGTDLGALVIALGVVLLTSKEGYPPADIADGPQRAWLRFLLLIPLFALGFLTCTDFNPLAWRLGGNTYLAYGGAILAVSSPIPLLLFIRLRGLARRVRSAPLAEHCLIVGVGASASVLYLAAILIVCGEVFDEQPAFMLGSTFFFLLMLVMTTASSLFILWSLYLLFCFGHAFGRARRMLRSKWTMDDRSLRT